jgi:uncharacterized RDD family membrane protein YckC
VVAVLWFWIAKQATPGKMALRLRIVDASSGDAATPGQYVGRYFGYLLACMPPWTGANLVRFRLSETGMARQAGKDGCRAQDDA